MLPLLFKYFWTPIQLEDIPALREDDGSASSLGAFRAAQAKRDAAYADKHSGQKRKRNLGWDLLVFFSPDIFIQAVSPTLPLSQLLLINRYGLPFSSCSNIFLLLASSFFYSSSRSEAPPTRSRCTSLFFSSS